MHPSLGDSERHGQAVAEMSAVAIKPVPSMFTAYQHPATLVVVTKIDDNAGDSR
jgi:hypothetical protein